MIECAECEKEFAIGDEIVTLQVGEFQLVGKRSWPGFQARLRPSIVHQGCVMNYLFGPRVKIWEDLDPTEEEGEILYDGSANVSTRRLHLR